MKILIFGAGGMIGHKMYQVLRKQGYGVYGTLRQPLKNYAQFSLFAADSIFENLDILNQQQVQETLRHLKPDVILNCVGITLRKPEIVNLDHCVRVNSEFPQFLKNWCENNRSHLIHFSTDCVFSGKDGPYSEKNYPSATDIYGRTKALGEVFSSQALTLRGSMIGPELFGKTEFFEWVLSQKGKSAKGFSKAIYSGVTTSVMANLVTQLLKAPEILSGLYQVSSKPISKYHLLQMINTAFDLGMTIAEDASYGSEKILNSQKLNQKIGFHCPEWTIMINDLVSDLANSSASEI